MGLYSVWYPEKGISRRGGRVEDIWRLSPKTIQDVQKDGYFLVPKKSLTFVIDL